MFKGLGKVIGGLAREVVNAPIEITQGAVKGLKSGLDLSIFDDKSKKKKKSKKRNKK